MDVYSFFSADLENILAEIFGYAGMLTILTAFFQRDDYTTKKLMVLATLFWGSHFFLQGQFAGLAACVMFIIRFFASIKFDKNIYIFASIIIVTLCVGVISYQNIYSLLPLLASLNGTVAFFYLSSIQLRISMVIGSQMWLWYHIIHGSASGILNEILAQGILIFTIYRLIHPTGGTQYYAQKIKEILWKTRRPDYDRFVFLHNKVSYFRKRAGNHFLQILHLDLKKSFLQKKWILCEKYLQNKRDQLRCE